MPKIQMTGVTTTSKLARKLYQFIAKWLPRMKQDLTPAEYTAVLGIMAALQAFLDLWPYPDQSPSDGEQA